VAVVREVHALPVFTLLTCKYWWENSKRNVCLFVFLFKLLNYKN
jgi:hypothetical protein